VFITLSCIKLGNIPENSLTQAHKRDHTPRDPKQWTTDKPAENSRE
jgi:hypothetical protein